MISEISREKEFRIMACGVTGHGKSTLLNGIVGRAVFKQGHGTHSETSQVDEYRERKENSTILVLDTPGFRESADKEREYLQEIRSKCRKVDALLYCMSMAEARITEDTEKQHLSTLTKLKKALNKKVWRSCIIVLTFANFAVLRIQEEVCEASAIRMAYNSDLDEWKKSIKSILSKAGIPNYDEIPIVAAGAANTPKILSDDEKAWLSILWGTIYDKSPVNGRAVLLHFNAHRLEEDGEISPSDESSKPIHQQKITIDASFKEKLWETIKRKHPTIAAAFTVGGGGGAVGAGIGATIGALAIGIPSFGIAAGVGLLLGGLIGGGIGIGVGVATGTAIEHVKKRCTEDTSNTGAEVATSEGSADD